MRKRSDFLYLPVLSIKSVVAFVMTTSLIAHAATPHSSVVQFGIAKSYAVGTSPNAVSVADVNGDGKLDLVVSNASGTISILLGNGDGSLQTANTFNAGTNISTVNTADLNGDTKPDLVILDVTSNGRQLGVLLNNGDGTFGAVQLLSGITNASSFAAGDLNGDQKVDIVVGDSGSSPAVHVLLGNGDGTFQSPLDLIVSLAPRSIYLADVNGDGRSDLVLAGFMGFDIYLGNGDGTFQSPLFVSTGYNSTVIPGDLNHDGKTDVAAFATGIFGHAPSFVTRLGNGDGTFQPSVSGGSPSGTLSLLADLDGDKAPEVLAQSGGNVYVWMNRGDATFFPFSVVAGGSSAGIGAADLNGDGANDLIVTNPGQNTVSVRLNAGTQISLNTVVLSPASISRGQSSTGTVTVNMLNSFVKPVTLSCQVTPQGQAQGTVPTCLIQPSSVAPGANASATAKLTLSANSSSASSFPRLRYVLLASACFGLLSLGGDWSKKRCAVLVIIGGLALQAACGGGNGTPPPPQPSIYAVTVSANAVSAQQSTSTTLTVQ